MIELTTFNIVVASVVGWCLVFLIVAIFSLKRSILLRRKSNEIMMAYIEVQKTLLKQQEFANNIAFAHTKEQIRALLLIDKNLQQISKDLKG